MSSKSDYRPGELLFCLLITIFSALALWQAYEISGLSGLSKPGVFPILAASTMLLSGFFILRDTYRLKKNSLKSDTPPEKFFETVLTLRLFIVIALVVIYILSMPYVGFMIASGCFMFVSFVYLWRKSLIISVLLTAFALASVYVIFRLAFQVVLPQGSLLTGLF